MPYTSRTAKTAGLESMLEERLEARRSVTDHPPHPVEVGLDRIFGFAQLLGDRADGLLAPMLASVQLLIWRRRVPS